MNSRLRTLTWQSSKAMSLLFHCRYANQLNLGLGVFFKAVVDKKWESAVETSWSVDVVRMLCC